MLGVLLSTFAVVAAEPDAAAPLSEEGIACLMSLSQMYSHGMTAAEIRRRAEATGLPIATIQPFLDYIGEGRATTTYPEELAPLLNDPGLYERSMQDFAAVANRFSTMTLAQRTIGVALLTTKPELQPAIGWLRRDIEELIPEGDFGAPPAPTGDALYDRYALEVDKRVNAYADWLQEDADGLTPAIIAAVRDDTLALWEGDFGSDGRYWELRYWCAKVRAKQLGPDKLELSPGFCVPADFLREAQRRGVARPAALLALFTESCTQRVAVRLNTRPDSLKAIGEAGSDGYNAEEKALLQDALDLNPSLCWTHYLLAIGHNGDRDVEAALAEIKAGNACADIHFPWVFPLDTVSSAPDLSAAPGGAAVCGSILLSSREKVWGIELRRTLRPVYETLAGSGRLADLSAVHELVGKLAADISIMQSVNQLNKAVILRLPIDAVAESGAPLTENELTMQARMNCAVEIGWQTCAAMFSRNSDPTVALTILTGVAAARGSCVAAYLGYASQTELSYALKEVLSDAASYSYLAPQASPALLQFPPLRQVSRSAWRRGGSLTRRINRRALDLVGAPDPAKEMMKLIEKVDAESVASGV